MPATWVFWGPSLWRQGLPDAQFAEATGDNGPLEFALPWEADNLASLFQSIRDWVIQETTIEQADSIIPQWRIQSILDSATDERKSISPLAYAEETNVDPNKTPTVTAEELARRETALAEREDKLRQDEEAAKLRDAKVRRDAVVSYADGLVTAGSILPRQKNTVVEVLLSLDTTPLSFADGDATVNKTPEELLRDVLSQKPKVMDFSEKPRLQIKMRLISPMPPRWPLPHRTIRQSRLNRVAPSP